MALLEAVLLLVAILAPEASAGAVEASGAPLIEDPADDVDYHAASVGPRDHAYLDILAFSIIPQGKNTTFVLTLADATKIESPPMDYTIQWQSRMDGLVNGTDAGHLSLTVEAGPGSVPPRAVFVPAGRADGVPLKHEVRTETPSNLIFVLPTDLLLFHAQSFRNFSSQAVELQNVGGLPTAIANGDRAYASDSERTFELVDEDPGMNAQPAAERGAAPSQRVDAVGSGESTGVPWVGAMAILLGVAVATRRRWV